MLFNNHKVKFHHADDHDHPHEHSHGHVHPHTHGESEQSKDEKTLNLLLVHWVNHNESHEEGFREWVEKARAIGKDDTANNIEQAIEHMKKANEMLIEAKKNM